MLRNDNLQPSLVQQLESIYAIETIDVRSLRLIQKDDSPVRVEKKQSLYFEEMQLEFDFGPFFRQWVSPPFLDEPIECLGLSKQCERLLLAADNKSVKDLHLLVKKGQSFLKGLGQGHWDEIIVKLEENAAGRNREKTAFIQFGSWIKILSASPHDRLKIYLCLESHQLAHLIKLSALEAMDLRRLNAETKNNLRNEGLKKLRDAFFFQKVEKWFKESSLAFIQPWMMSRQGVVDKNELLERLELVSEEPEHSNSYVAFFEEVYGSLANLLSLELLSKDLFCAASYKKELFVLIENKAAGYFCRAQDIYMLEELSRYVSRELGKQWIEFEMEFILKVLTYSSKFEISRTSHGLAVKKASSRIKQAIQEWQGAPCGVGS